MYLVITMAGRNTRFHDVGFDLPKYLLPMGQRTVISEILRNLLTEVGPENTFLIAHERDSYFENRLMIELKPLEVPSANIMYIGETKGQAHTAFIATTKLNLKNTKPIFFHNADTVLYGRNLTKYLNQMLNSGAAGIIDTFYASEMQYSYVETKDLFVTKSVEKKIISNHATSGLYGFSSVSTFKEAYHSVLQNNGFRDSEHFFSPLYQNMISDNHRITFLHNENFTDGNNTRVLGTPAEYQKAISELGGEE